MNLLNLIENTTTGYDNLRALMQASTTGQDAVLNVGGETISLDPVETRWMFGKYKAFNKAGRQEEFLNHLADPVKFDQHMRQLRQMLDKQKNFRGSVPGQRDVQETEQQWMQSTKQQYPSVKFTQNKTTMEIFAMVPGKGKVGTFDPRQQVKEFTQNDVLDTMNQTDAPPRRAYTIVLDGRPGQKYRAEQAWKALTSVFPKDYPGESAEHKISEVSKKGSAVVKTGIASEDLAQTYVSKLSKFVPVKNWRIVGGDLEEATGDGKFDSMMGKISQDPWTRLNADPNWEYEIEELVDRNIEPWLLTMEKSGMPITRDEDTLNPGWRKRYEQVANQLAQKYLISKGMNPRDPDLVGKIRYAIDSHTDQSKNVHGQLSAYSDLPLARYQNDFDADGMTANIRDAMVGFISTDDDDDDEPPTRPMPDNDPRRLDPGNMEEGVADGKSTVEEIAMPNTRDADVARAGKLNFERMIMDYKGNKPYTDFEFGSDRGLTLYRNQVYAILKAFGAMKPPQKINIILNTFGDKTATVQYLEKLRAKGMMLKKVPAYVDPESTPASPGQMEIPGLGEAVDQKKNTDTIKPGSAVNPRVARALQLARARQGSAKDDNEAMVADFVDQQDKDQQEFTQVKSVNRRQDKLLRQVTAVNQQQDQEIDNLDADNVGLQNNLQQVQAVNDELAKKLAGLSQRRSAPVATPAPTAAAPVSTPQEPAEPAPTAAAPVPTPAVTQPAVVKQPKPRKKSSTNKTVKSKRSQSTGNNVLPFPQGGRQPAPDDVTNALQGVDMTALGTGTDGLREDHESLDVGDMVRISGNVEHAGKSGSVAGFGRDGHFVIVDLDNFGKHAFHASNVERNSQVNDEDTMDEGRMKDLAISGQSVPQPRTGSYDVVYKKQGDLLPVKTYTDSARATRHAQNIKNKYPSLEVAIRDAQGTVKYIGIKEMQTDLDRYNVNQPPAGGTKQQREKFLDARDRLFRQMQSASPGEKEAIRLKIAELEGQAQSQGIRIRESDDAATVATVQARIAQLDKLIQMKQLIDRLFVRAQNARGGIYPGLQSDIENQQLYGVPKSDRDYQELLAKYTKDLTALKKFLAMKKSVYRESEPASQETTALAGLKQARQALATGAMKESLRRDEYYIATVTLDNGDVRRVKVTTDEDFTNMITKHFAGKGHTVVDIDMDYDIQGPVREQAQAGASIPAKSIQQGYTVFFDPATRMVSVTRGGTDSDAAIEQERISKPTMLAFNSAVYRMIAKIEDEMDSVTEVATDYQKRRQRERDVDAGRAVKPLPRDVKTDYQKKRAQDRKDMTLGEGIPFDQCPSCGGSIVHESELTEKQDACYHKVKSRYKVWPSAYASGALVQCRKKGAANWGNKSESIAEQELDEKKWSAKYKSSINCANPKGFSQKAHCAGKKK